MSQAKRPSPASVRTPQVRATASAPATWSSKAGSLMAVVWAWAVSRDPADVAGVVTWMGALQAQDLASGLWSFGVRLPRFTLDEVTAALERREAVRTWPMRGTVHFVPPRDVHWMLDLMGSRALAGAAKRRAFLGLSEEVADPCCGGSRCGAGRWRPADPRPVHGALG